MQIYSLTLTVTGEQIRVVNVMCEGGGRVGEWEEEEEEECVWVCVRMYCINMYSDDLICCMDLLNYFL